LLVTVDCGRKKKRVSYILLVTVDCERKKKRGTLHFAKYTIT